MKTLAIVVSLATFFSGTLTQAAEATPATQAGEQSGSLKEGNSDSSARPPHVRKKVVRRRPVHAYKPARPSGYRSRVIVHRPVVVRGPSVYVESSSRPVARRSYSTRDEAGVGIGVRVSGIRVDGQKLNLDTVENATMGGVGLQVRGALDAHWSLEASVDWLYSDSGSMQQTTVPLMLSALYTFIPDGPIRPYGLFGAGLHLTALEYANGFRHDMVELAAQAGFGMDLRLADNFGLQLDLRFLGVYKNLDAEDEIYSDCVMTLGSSPFCSAVSTEDKFNLGTQFMVGANWFF